MRRWRQSYPVQAFLYRHASKITILAFVGLVIVVALLSFLIGGAGVKP